VTVTITRWVGVVVVVTAVVLVCTLAPACESPTERRQSQQEEPVPEPDPSALEPAKHRPDAALQVVTWSGERTMTILYTNDAGQLLPVRQRPYQKAGRWYGFFAFPVVVVPGTPKVIQVSASPIGTSKGIAHSSIYYNNQELDPHSVISGPVSSRATVGG
jgi:hypothetical protein